MENQENQEFWLHVCKIFKKMIRKKEFETGCTIRCGFTWLPRNCQVHCDSIALINQIHLLFTCVL